MLKLTNRFCRYLKFSCQNISNRRIHVKTFTNLTNVKQTCDIENNVSNLYLARHRRQFSVIASLYKKINIKDLFSKPNERKKSKQMSESLQPSTNHVSYGGHFEVSDNNPGSDWRKVIRPSESSKDADNTEASTIPANFRVWEQVHDQIDEGNSFKFSVLSYNVLAQYLLECHPYLYTDCGSYNLKWKVRAEKLYDEIVKINPDILCLQEVQASHIETFYSNFEQIGYCGIYKQKTGHRHDGCAIYFKKSQFDLLNHVSVEYYQPELPILNRDNIGVMAKLRPRNYNGPPIVVATTHLLYNPKRTDVRLAQIQVFLAEIDRFAYCINGNQPGHLPIILTGDFNSTPDSAVIKLLDQGHVAAGPYRDSSDWKKIGVTDNCQHLSVYLNRQRGIVTEFNMTQIHNTDYRSSTPSPDSPPLQCFSMYNELFNTPTVSHSLNLASTYDRLKPDGSEEATTFQDYWVTVDYIYFSYCSTLRLRERLRLPTSAECDVLGKLPNEALGSDHLLLAAVFELSPCPHVT